MKSEATFSLGGNIIACGGSVDWHSELSGHGVLQRPWRPVNRHYRTCLISDSTGNILGQWNRCGIGHRPGWWFAVITGDNNANDRLDVGDATRIQRLLVRTRPIARAWDVIKANDLNGSGSLDPGDVTKVLRTVVGLSIHSRSRNRSHSQDGGGR